MSHLPLPSKSTIAASTIPAMVYLGYLMMSKPDQNSKNNSRPGYNNNNNSTTTTSQHQFTQNSFNSQLQEKLFKVQRSRLDPIEEEKDYWH